MRRLDLAAHHYGWAGLCNFKLGRCAQIIIKKVKMEQRKISQVAPNNKSAHASEGEKSNPFTRCPAKPLRLGAGALFEYQRKKALLIKEVLQENM